MPGAATGSAGPVRPEEAQVRAILARSPTDLAARLALARLRPARRDMKGTWEETQRVLERAPNNPEALALQALVHLAAGRPVVALDLLKQALATDPNLADGYAYMALVYFRMGRLPDAEAVVADASKRFPDKAAGLQQLLADLQVAAGGDGQRELGLVLLEAHLDPGGDPIRPNLNARVHERRSAHRSASSRGPTAADTARHSLTDECATWLAGSTLPEVMWRPPPLGPARTRNASMDTPSSRLSIFDAGCPNPRGHYRFQALDRLPRHSHSFSIRVRQERGASFRSCAIHTEWLIKFATSLREVEVMQARGRSTSLSCEEVWPPSSRPPWHSLACPP